MMIPSWYSRAWLQLVSGVWGTHWCFQILLHTLASQMIQVTVAPPGPLRHVLGVVHCCIGYIGREVPHETRSLTNIWIMWPVDTCSQWLSLMHGYSNQWNTKDLTHDRCCGGHVGKIVHFINTMTLQTRKEDFLCHPENKQRFINILSQKLECKDCDAQHAKGNSTSSSKQPSHQLRLRKRIW